MGYAHLGRSGLLVSRIGLGTMNVIAGPRTVAQLESAVSAATAELDADTLAELDRIWPGPGEAPRPYAW